MSGLNNTLSPALGLRLTSLIDAELNLRASLRQLLRKTQQC